MSASMPRIPRWRRRPIGRVVRPRNARELGQSLTEFAISAPVVLLMVLFGLDFGRVFLGWITLASATREAANYAALNPDAWTLSNTEVIAEYRRLITTETTSINCAMPGTPPNPSFPNGNGLGAPAVVTITCRFSLITPIIGQVIGQAINVTASASFPIRSGKVEGIPIQTVAPTPTVAPTATPFPTTTPFPTATPWFTPAPTPVPTCTVPDLVGRNTSSVINTWTNAGFDANKLVFNPLVPPNYKIRTQTLSGTRPCDSTMTVTP